MRICIFSQHCHSRISVIFLFHQIQKNYDIEATNRRGCTSESLKEFGLFLGEIPENRFGETIREFSCESLWNSMEKVLEDLLEHSLEYFLSTFYL